MEMRHILATPIIGLTLLHLSTYLGFAPNMYLVVLLSIPLLGYFIYSIILTSKLKRSNQESPFEAIFGNIQLKQFFLIFWLAIYFVINFIVSASLGGSTKTQNGKYYALTVQKYPKEYYEITKEEYLNRKPFQIRLISGHVIAFGLIGFMVISNVKFSSKNRI